MFTPFKKRPKIGLALGGGGPKGLAHIGVIKSLIKHNIPIDFIAGTSAGSIAAIFYAARKNVYEMEEYIIKKNWWQMLSLVTDPSFKEGILQGKRLQDFMEGYLGRDLQFSDLKIPCKAVAVDLKDGKVVAIDQGSVVTGILASSAAPMILRPVLLDGRFLVDGGITSPVPVDTVRKMGADIVIGVNLEKHYSYDDISGQMNFLSVARHSFSVMIHNIASYEVKQADLVIAPNISNVHWKTLLQEKDKVEGIRHGEIAMDEGILSLEVLIKSKQPFFPSLFHKLKKVFT